MPEKIVLPVKGQSANVGGSNDFDQAEIKLSWTTKAGNIKPDLDLMIFGITEDGKNLGIFSNLYNVAPQAWTGKSQGQLGDFPYMELDQDAGAWQDDAPLTVDEADDETVQVAAFAGHKEIYVCLYNYSATKPDGQPTPFKDWGTKLTMTLKKGGEVLRTIEVNVDDPAPGIGVRVAKFTVVNGTATISNVTKVFGNPNDMKAEIPGSGTFFDAKK